MTRRRDYRRSAEIPRRPSALGLLVLRTSRHEDTNPRSACLGFNTAVDANLPTVPFDELLRNEKANSCADRSPRREEGIEHLRQNIRWYPYSVVCNREYNPVGRRLGVMDRN